MDAAIGRGLGGVLFFAAGLICAGFAVAMFYEAVAVWSQHVETISEITHDAAVGHPVWGTVLVGAACFLVGALLVHFTGWKA